jgi:hypothetical protein
MTTEGTPTTGAENEGAEGKEPEGGKPEGKPEGEGAPQADADIEAIAAQAKNPDAVRNALVAERRKASEALQQAQDAAAKVKEFEDRDLSEQQKLEKRASEAEAKAANAEANLLRFEVAATKKLAPELAARLVGKNKRELEADADRLLELVKPSGKPGGDADGGKGEGGGSQDFNAQLRQQYAGRK